jgi:hypothetical protein
MMQNLHNPSEAWQAKGNGLSWAGGGAAQMTLRGLIGMAGEALAVRHDAKLALVTRETDPLALPAWGFTFHIENQRRLASSILCGPTAAVVLLRRSSATRGA